MDSGLLSHNPDNQYEKHKDDEQIPIVEQHLSHGDERNLVGMAEQFDEVDGEVLSEEMEADDVQEVGKDGNGIERDVNDVDKTLQSFIVNQSRRETIKEDGQEIDAKYDGKVETHPIEIER